VALVRTDVSEERLAVSPNVLSTLSIYHDDKGDMSSETSVVEEPHSVTSQ
jgi:hypothetical protein